MVGVSFQALTMGRTGAIGLTYKTTAVDTTSKTTYTFLGAVATSTGARKVVCVTTSRAAAARTLASCTLAGITATCTTLGTTTTGNIGIAVCDVAAGSSGDVVVTWSVGGGVRCAIAVYDMTGAASDTPAGTGSDTTDPFAYALTCVAGSAAFGGVTGATNTTATWTNLNEDVDATYSNQIYTMASATFATAQSGTSLSCTGASAITGTGGFAYFVPA